MSATFRRTSANRSGVWVSISLNWLLTKRNAPWTVRASTPSRRSIPASSNVPSARTDSAAVRSTITPPNIAVLVYNATTGNGRSSPDVERSVTSDPTFTPRVVAVRSESITPRLDPASSVELPDVTPRFITRSAMPRSDATACVTVPFGPRTEPSTAIISATSLMNPGSNWR